MLVENYKEAIKNLFFKLLQGSFIGISLVLPGMSGGTALIILGLYRNFLKDISELNIKRYIIIGVGIAVGVLVCALFITRLLDYYPDLLVSFLMGMLIASIRIVFAPLRRDQLRIFYLLFAGIGFAAAWTVVGEPIAQVPDTPDESIFMFFTGGVLTSATMLLPGVSGSSILIIINLYDNLLQAVVKFEIWPSLVFFVLGLGIGVILFARLILSLYNRFQGAVSFLLAGLLLGSTKALIPGSFGPGVVIFAIAGFLIIFMLTGKKTAP